MYRRSVLNGVVLERVTFLEMLACEEETLMYWLDIMLVMNLGLDVFNPVIGINIERRVVSSRRPAYHRGCGEQDAASSPSELSSP